MKKYAKYVKMVEDTGVKLSSKEKVSMEKALDLIAMLFEDKTLTSDYTKYGVDKEMCFSMFTVAYASSIAGRVGILKHMFDTFCKDHFGC